MNEYTFKYEYKELEEEQEVQGSTILGAIGNFLEEVNIPLESVIQISLKQ